MPPVERLAWYWTASNRVLNRNRRHPPRWATIPTLALASVITSTHCPVRDDQFVDTGFLVGSDSVSHLADVAGNDDALRVFSDTLDEGLII